MPSLCFPGTYYVLPLCILIKCWLLLRRVYTHIRANSMLVACLPPRTRVWFAAGLTACQFFCSDWFRDGYHYAPFTALFHLPAGYSCTHAARLSSLFAPALLADTILAGAYCGAHAFCRRLYCSARTVSFMPAMPAHSCALPSVPVRTVPLSETGTFTVFLLLPCCSSAARWTRYAFLSCFAVPGLLL
jgi:hypothetical protein